METKQERIAIFNDKYEVMKELGSGKTSKVFLCRELEEPFNLVAVKLYKSEYLSN